MNIPEISQSTVINLSSLGCSRSQRTGLQNCRTFVSHLSTPLGKFCTGNEERHPSKASRGIMRHERG